MALTRLVIKNNKKLQRALNGLFILPKREQFFYFNLKTARKIGSRYCYFTTLLLMKSHKINPSSVVSLYDSTG